MGGGEDAETPGILKSGCVPVEAGYPDELDVQPGQAPFVHVFDQVVTGPAAAHNRHMERIESLFRFRNV